MAHLYFVEDLPTDKFAVGSTIHVRGEEARHAVRVARLRTGERIQVGNGSGLIGSGVVTETERDAFAVELDAIQDVLPHVPRLVLVQGLAKGDRDERAVEQATEYGVDEIIPWEAARSVSRWGNEKSEKGVSKWRRLAREASKQSLRAWIPEVHQPLTTAELCACAQDPDSTLIVLHPDATRRVTEIARDPSVSSTRQILLVIGPEGGIAPEELAQLRDAGAHIAILGDTVLRTSSAGPAALAVLNAALGRW